MSNVETIMNPSSSPMPTRTKGKPMQSSMMGNVYTANPYPAAMDSIIKEMACSPRVNRLLLQSQRPGVPMKKDMPVQANKAMIM